MKMSSIQNIPARGRSYLGHAWDIFGISCLSDQTAYKQEQMKPVCMCNADQNNLIKITRFVRNKSALTMTKPRPKRKHRVGTITLLSHSDAFRKHSRSFVGCCEY